MKKIKSVLIKKNLGMTYVELIVVLSIMSIMSAVVLFNYQDFQTKVDMKNLSSEIAQKLTQAQKFSMSGESNINAVSDWRPSYGLFFSKNNPKTFAYFADLDNSLSNNKSIDSYGAYPSGNPFSCSPANPECLDVVSINKSYSISNLKIGFPLGSCESSGGGSGGGGTGACLSKKQEIAHDYDLKYLPPSGYFEKDGSRINPNAGLYPYKEIFVELNEGSEYSKDKLVLKTFEIGEQKIGLYIFRESVGIHPETGFYVDLESGKYIYIPEEEPSICNEGATVSDGSTSKGYVSEVFVNNLAITFRRPDSRAVIQSDSGLDCVPSYAEIDLGVSGSTQSKVLIYPSGRVQIK